MTFLKRNLAFFRLAIITNLEYRFNFILDAVVQPSITALIELILWTAIFAAATGDTIGGFTKDYYLAYVLWAAFFARVTSNWMYEFKMIEEIEMGSINSLLVRPISFFESYLSQLLGYKSITTFFSFGFPLAAVLIFSLPTHLERIPLALLLIFYYLILVQVISFLVACLAFSLNRIYSVTTAKNLALWLFSGELVPLDLIPKPLGIWIEALPFGSAVFVPVGYITGRLGVEKVYSGFYSITITIVILGTIAFFMWKNGLKKYVGTGA